MILLYNEYNTYIIGDLFMYATIGYNIVVILTFGQQIRDQANYKSRLYVINA